MKGIVCSFLLKRRFRYQLPQSKKKKIVTDITIFYTSPFPGQKQEFGSRITLNANVIDQ